MRGKIIYFCSLTERVFNCEKLVEELYDEVNFKFSSFLLKLKWRMIEGADKRFSRVSTCRSENDELCVSMFPKKEKERCAERRGTEKATSAMCMPLLTGLFAELRNRVTR